MALAVRVAPSPTSLGTGSYYFSQEPLLYYFDAYDDVTNNTIPDSSTLKHQFEFEVTLGGEFVGRYFLPYTPGTNYCQIDFKEICAACLASLAAFESAIIC